MFFVSCGLPKIDHDYFPTGTCILGFWGCNSISHWRIETAMNWTKNYRTGPPGTIEMYLHTTVVLDFSSWIKPVSGFWCPVLLRSFGIRCCATHWVWSSFQQLAGGSSWALTRQETPHLRVGSILGQFQRISEKHPWLGMFFWHLFVVMWGMVFDVGDGFRRAATLLGTGSYSIV